MVDCGFWRKRIQTSTKLIVTFVYSIVSLKLAMLQEKVKLPVLFKFGDNENTRLTPDEEFNIK